MIVYKTILNEIPKSCSECKCEWCSFPTCNNGYRIKKAYLTKRHERCPLINGDEFAKEIINKKFGYVDTDSFN